MAEFRIYHVVRNLAKHNYELDDRWYGSPLTKDEEDWPLKNPKLYLARVKKELAKVNMAIDDLAYLMREKNCEKQIPEAKVPTLEEANAHAFHKFHVRQFEYVEKLSHLINENAPGDISLSVPKAERQLNVLLAAREDLLVTQVRFTEYANQVKN